MYAKVSASGALGSNKHATGAVRVSFTGGYLVSFDKDVSVCAWTAASEGAGIVDVAPGAAFGGTSNDVSVAAQYPPGTPADQAFDLTVTC
jgi:hypothetical protein